MKKSHLNMFVKQHFKAKIVEEFNEVEEVSHERLNQEFKERMSEWFGSKESTTLDYSSEK